MEHEYDGPTATNEQDDAHGREAVTAVRNGSKVEADLRDATAWFMSEKDANVKATKTIEVDVGATEEHLVRWRVQAISRERIRQIRNTSRIKRGRGMTDDVNDVKANLLIATEGTIEPDLVAIAKEVGAPEPSVVLDKRMAHKPGLIDQIAGTVLEVSGYDDDDIRDVAAVKN